MTDQTLDLAGIGIGPFNLSIAALLDSQRSVNALFLDNKPAFSWHPGMQLPGSRLQTSCLKDLVTGVDPCNPHSFLNYLVQHGRFYDFLSANMPAISRAEYADYLGWVAARLGNLRFDSPVESVQFNGNHFVLQVTGRRTPLQSRNLCIGTGIHPHVPPACSNLPPEKCFHSIDIMRRQPDLSGERVTVIGGGQSGAEILLGLMDGIWGEPKSITWISRRPNFEPLDETPFTNQYFTPGYVRAFQTLDESRRRELVRYQKLASDGISPDTLNALYQRLYEYPLAHPDRPAPDLLPGRSLYAVSDGAPMQLLSRNQLDERFEETRADRIILCTGFEHRLPECLEPLTDKLDLDHTGQPRPDTHFSLHWDGPEDRHIYAVNQGRYSHGIAESQLSLMCWRSAVIVNHLTGDERYPVKADGQLPRWFSQSSARTVAGYPTTTGHPQIHY